MMEDMEMKRKTDTFFMLLCAILFVLILLSGISVCSTMILICIITDIAVVNTLIYVLLSSIAILAVSGAAWQKITII